MIRRPRQKSDSMTCRPRSRVGLPCHLGKSEWEGASQGLVPSPEIHTSLVGEGKLLLPWALWAELLLGSNSLLISQHALQAWQKGSCDFQRIPKSEGNLQEIQGPTTR